MLRAIIFDFDGVVADNEPAHFAMFQRVLGEIGIPLTEREYFADYLGYDDKGCFAAVLAGHGRPPPKALVDGLAARQAPAFFEHTRRPPVIFPGVPGVVREAARRDR